MDLHLHLLPEISQAIHDRQPVVALESTVITHGLPYPENMKLAMDMEAEVRRGGAVPATVAVLSGQVHLGLKHEQLLHLAQSTHQMHKISVRDFAPAVALGWSGGTTVAGTLAIAQRAGVQVFATGGIGGVHREAPTDISADLPQLACSPVVVICAGAKAILDLPATLEYLETVGVPVLGYQCDEFPAFYARSSGLPVSARADSPAEIVAIAQAHWGMGFQTALLVANPPPEHSALAPDHIEAAVHAALAEAKAQGIRGQAVTPFLLSQVSRLTHGESLQANLALLLNNARLAAQVAVQFSSTGVG